MLKKLISFLLTAVMSASVTSVFAADDTANDVIDDNIVITAEDTVLVKDVDYTLEYQDNVNVGTAKVIVHFIGNYSGEREQTFKIKKQSSGGGGGGGGSSSSSSSSTAEVSVVDKDGNTVNASKVVKNDTVTITLPSGKTIDDDNGYTVTVTDKNGNPKDNFSVTIKDKSGNTETGITDTNGKVTLPIQPETTQAPATPVPETHTAYITGYPEDDFKPDGNITRAETAAMLSRVMPLDNTGGKAFSDVSSDVWYYEPIMSMSSAGIIMGYTDGTFKPDNNITRAEFVAMLMRNLNVQTFDSLPFTDVSSDLWSADYIYSAYTAGYINGYEDGSFRPDSPITRAEAVKIINGVLGRSDFSSETNPFSDVSDTHWAYTQILEAAVEHQVKK